MAILTYIIAEIFSVAAIFMALIALLGLLLQKKSFGDVVTGVFKTAIGVVILQQGTSVLVAALAPLATAIAALQNSTPFPEEMIGSDRFMEEHSMEIGLAMIFGFVLNLLFARFTKWKAVFLTGHMLYWFPFVFAGVAVSMGLSKVWVIVVASLFTAAYYIISPNLIRPYIREVIGDDSFTLGHPSISFALVGGFLAKKFGDKSKSTEDTEFPKSLKFLKEVAITGSIVVILAYTVVTIAFKIAGIDYSGFYSLVPGTFGVLQFIITSGLKFGAGLTILLLGVRMVIGEIVPAFTGIQEKLIPNAVPAYDCPLLFPYAPNAVIIGFLFSMLTSVILIFVTGPLHIFKYAVIPVVITCFFECGTASVVGNALGGRRGAIIASITSGVMLVFLLGFSLPFCDKTIADWMLGSSGQDFSLWAIIEGLILKLFGAG